MLDNMDVLKELNVEWMREQIITNSKEHEDKLIPHSNGKTAGPVSGKLMPRNAFHIED